MINRILLLLAIALSSTAFAQNRKTLDTKITDVTVFLNGAQVTHSGDVSLKTGENVLTVSDLPLNMDPNSVQVEGTNDYTILSVRHQVNYLVNQSRNPRIKAIQDSLEDLQFKLKEIAALKSVLNQEKSLFEANRDIKGENSPLLSEDLEEMAALFRERFKQIEYRWLELSEQEKETQEEAKQLQNQLNSLNARISQNPSEVLVTIQSPRDQKANIRMSYVAQNAGWIPLYDLRAADINSPIEFIYRARVFQSTGNDWEDVNLTLSTGNPAIGGQIPELTPWYLYLYDPVTIYTKRAQSEAGMAPQMAADASLDEEYARLTNSYQTAASYTSVQSNGVSTEFKISIPYDVPSDNQQYDVTMQRQELKASYRYVTIPKLDGDAFLRAQITDWMQYALLPGESNIYFKGTFVGKGFIDPALAVDTLNLSLGRDRSIQVKREQIKDYCKTSIFGSKQKTTKAFEITVTNTKKQAVELDILDQLPISQNGEIEVEQEEISGASYDPQTGRLTWKVTLQPGETIKKQLRFNVKYPKKRYIGNL